MDCTIVVHPELDTRLVHGFSVAQVEGGRLGVMRVGLTDFALQTGNAIKSTGTKRPPGTVENNINGQLQSDFPSQFVNTINSSFIIPGPTLQLLTLWSGGGMVTSIAQLQDLVCDRDSDCPIHDGPEDGCFFPGFAPRVDSLSPLLVADVVNAQLGALFKGVCVQRFEPKRVNITPTSVDIVLAEDDRDPLIRTIQLFAQQMNGTIQCSATPKQSTNPARLMLLAS